MTKKNVGIIFGGESTEHEVSRRSAVHVITSLDKSKFTYTLIEMTKKGTLLLYDECDEEILSREILNVENGLAKNPVVISEDLINENNIDVIFSVIHGTGGEDGVLQGFLEMCGIPFVGAGVAGSAVGFDKAISKIMFSHARIPQAKYLCYTTETLNYDKAADEIEEKLGFPVFIKPSNGGSSVGIYKAKTRDELIDSIKKASAYDRKIIIEEFVPGREFECAVIGGYEDAEALGVGEIVPCNEFYDYNAKYIDEDSLGIIPAPIDEKLTEEIMKLSVEAFKAVDCYGLARVDFFMTEDGSIILNEINTMPGFTSISMYPKIWVATGGTPTQLMDRLIELAFARKNDYHFLKDYCEEPENV